VAWPFRSLLGSFALNTRSRLFGEGAEWNANGFSKREPMMVVTTNFNLAENPVVLAKKKRSYNLDRKPTCIGYSVTVNGISKRDRSL
jgi:hypothetical protein